MIYLFRPYANTITSGIYIIWMLLLVVGMGSVFFHSTLTLAGQFMDELSILWVLMLSYAILFPDKYIPSYFIQNRSLLNFICLMTTGLITFGCFLMPKLNAYFLMLFALPTVFVIVLQTRNCDNPQVKALAYRSVFTAFTAITLWILDRAMCDFWIWINAPVLHSIFHVLIFFSSSSSIVLFAYFKAAEKASHLAPDIAYWPSSKRVHQLFCIPYIYFSRIETTSHRYAAINKQNSSSEDFKAAISGRSSSVISRKESKDNFYYRQHI